MKSRIVFFIKYCLFWLFFFFLSRLIFLMFHFNLSSEMPVKDWVGIFQHGLHMDLSLMGYLMFVPGIFLMISIFFSGRFYFFWFIFFTMILTLIFSFIVATDLELYTHWGFRMDKTPFSFLNTPKEALASASFWVLIRQIAIAVALFVSAIYLYLRFVSYQIFTLQKVKWQNFLVFLLITVSLVIPIRGGFGIAPMNPGTVYFHKNPFANHAAVNVIWNVGYSFGRNSEDQALKVDFMPIKKADSLFKQLHPPTSDFQSVLNQDKPNVLLVILESFTGNVIEGIGGDGKYTPNFSKLKKEGIFFTNFYASGDRSDKGLVSILSGFPAQPTTSIIKYPEKTGKLPFLSKVLKAQNYQTAYYYGGDLNFANMKSYLLTGEFSRFVTKDNFDAKLNDSKWGVHDQHLFDMLQDDLKTQKSPFFITLFTLSSHDPFEVPMQSKVQGNDTEHQFANSIMYTDQCLGDFIEKAKQTDWWKKTLVVIIADHGVPYVGNLVNHDPKKYHIPMLWLGGAIAAKDTNINTYASQVDIAATLLAQLKLPASDFVFSKNILAKAPKSFAYYSFNNGFGFLSDSTQQVFDNTASKYLISKGNQKPQNENFGKAYLQILARDFKNRGAVK